MWVMPVLPFLKLYRHMFLHGEFNTWKFSFCNFQMFCCYLWGRPIPFIFFVCMLNTHTQPSSHLATKQGIFFSLIFIFPLPLNTDQAWKISSQRNNSSQSCDANEEGVVMMYTWIQGWPLIVASRGANTGLGRPPPHCVHPSTACPATQPPWASSPTLPTKRMKAFILSPRMPWKRACENPLCVLCGLGHSKMENVGMEVWK